MSRALSLTFQSSVVKKQLVGITGLLLCGFLVTHLAGNFLLFVSPEAFNKYGHTLTSNPLIYVAEAGLFVGVEAVKGQTGEELKETAPFGFTLGVGNKFAQQVTSRL